MPGNAGSVQILVLYGILVCLGSILIYGHVGYL